MAAIPGSVTITGFVAPTDTADTYPTHSDTYGHGGYRPVADLTERNAISADRRKEGMLVYVIADGTTYQLASDLTSWTEYSSGAGGSDVHKVTIKAGENLGGYRAVYADSNYVYHADKDTATDRDKIVGITDSPYNINENAGIFVNGSVTNGSWSFTPGPVFVGTDGVLTQPEPTGTAFIVKVGVAVNSTTIVIDVDRDVADHGVYGGTF